MPKNRKNVSPPLLLRGQPYTLTEVFIAFGDIHVSVLADSYNLLLFGITSPVSGISLKG